MVYRLLRPLIFALDSESAHRRAMAAARALDRLARRAPGLAAPLRVPELEQSLWGARFPNPVGLAAGFDKNAEVSHAWSILGFGFAELGTITAEAQPGNPPPRIFRFPRERALVNRMGFNNHGAEAIAERCARGWRRPPIPVGFNLGKSRATPIEDAAADYVRGFRLLRRFADYVVLNVSSPNTPGLRDLQAEERLCALLAAVNAENRALAERDGREQCPVLVKLSPDLGDEGLAAAARIAVEGGAAGIVATNTTIGREGLRAPVSEDGGLSGAPLRARATAAVRIVYEATQGAVPIIGSGGVFTAGDAWEKFRAGASLVQLYTGLIYEGPFLARRIVRGLRRRLRAEGLSHLSELIGRDARSQCPPTTSAP